MQYVIRNTYDNEGKSGSRKRRWRVYLNEIDYVTSDFVILSGRKQQKYYVYLVDILVSMEDFNKLIYRCVFLRGSFWHD